MLGSPWIIGQIIMLAAASVLGAVLLLRAKRRRDAAAARPKELAPDDARDEAIDKLLVGDEELKEAIKSGRVRINNVAREDPCQKPSPGVWFSLGDEVDLRPVPPPVPHIKLPRQEGFAQSVILPMALSDSRMALSDSASPDKVECSVFTRPKVMRGLPLKIQALLHLRSDILNAAELAAGTEAGTNKRATATLSASINRGALVKFFLDCAELEIDEPFLSVKWEGKPAVAVFNTYIPAELSVASLRPVVHVQVGNCPLGEIEFSIRVVADEHSVRPPRFSAPITAWGATVEEVEPEVFVEATPIRYARPFISYSRKDFDRVSFFAQAFEEQGVRPIVDVTSLEPGDDWAAKLHEFVKGADVVYVMWSSNAAGSQWVGHEARLACQLNEASNGLRPKVKPMLMEKASPKLPDHLMRFHAFSFWQALRTAHEVGVFDDKSDDE